MYLKKSMFLALGALLFLTGVPTFSWADASCPAKNPDDKCTSFCQLATTINNPQPGILTNINNYIKEVISGDGTQQGASEKLFSAFTGNSNYQNAVMAAATLAVTILGVAFAIGIMQASFGQLLKRLFVIGIIFTVISPNGWSFFSEYVVHFFADGTDELIGDVMSIGTGIPYAPGQSPFLAIDGIANYIISPDTIIAIVGATFSGGPYGGFMGFLLGWCFMGFLKMLIEALRVYAVSYILRALLFGVAPIFIAFLLFEKTKPMFVAWVNALVNFSLKPVLYFTFLSFFLVLISSATKDMLGGAELCWQEFQHTTGGPSLRAGWRFTAATYNPNNNNQGATKSAPVTGEPSWNGFMSCVVSGEKCSEFPINVLDLLSFVILISIAMKFGSVVDNISSEISNSFVGVGQQAKMDIFGKGSSGASGGGGGDPNPGAAGQVRKPPEAPPAPRTEIKNPPGKSS